ncbi:carboxypeptidase regulatory-like domain-containing protein, partial [Candidatus Uhrbacteria bacterium]|nr:carboxypeptidase regulatory-like domain-containing protein [Candidatus Uhrbacteria bacterium]
RLAVVDAAGALPRAFTPDVRGADVGEAGGMVESPRPIRITAPSPESTIGTSTVTVVGIAAAGAAVEVVVDSTPHGTAVVGANQEFAFTVGGLVPGLHDVVVRLPAGSDTVRFTVAEPADALIVTSPGDGSATNADVITIRGRAPAAVPVTITLDDRTIGNVTSDPSGDFAIAVSGVIPEGPHRIRAAATTTRGTIVRAESTFHVDRTPPPPPPIRELATISRVPSSEHPGAFDVSVELRGSFPEDVFREIDAVLVTIASEPVTLVFTPATAVWSHRITVPLEPGTHTVRVASRDRAGNISPAAEAMTLVVPPPACADGADNDLDGLVDFPADTDCRDARGDREDTIGVIARVADVVRTTTVATVETIAEGTTKAAVATARTAERAAVVVHERVLDNPAVEVATERVVAPAVVVAVTANTATAAQGFELLNYLQYLIGIIVQPSRLFGRRKRKPWGTVYASLTKRPVDLATVRLLDATSGKAVQSVVTDHLGRFGFLIQRPGTYRIEVRHPAHVFPSAQLRGRAEDGDFFDLSFGEPFTVNESGAILSMNVPVDAKAQAGADSDTRALRRHYLRIMSAAIANAGLVLSIVSFGVSPAWHTGAILIVNGVSFAFFRRIGMTARRPKSWGAVTETRKHAPLHLAVVRLFDREFNKLLETAVTDRYGRYRFLVGKNAYYVSAQKAGFAPVKSHVLDLTKEESIVGVDLALRRASGS